MLAKNKEQALNQKIAQIQQQCEHQRKQYQSLQSYRQAYRQSLSVPDTSLSIQQVLETEAFQLHLGQALSEQDQNMKQNETYLESLRAEWRMAYAKIKTMESLVDKAKQQEDKAAEKQVQKIMDDYPRKAYPKKVDSG